MIENLFTFVRTLGNQRIEGKKFFVTQVGLLGTVSDNTGSIGTAGKVLSSTGSGVQWITVGSSNVQSLNDLTDVVISTVAEGNLLRYNGTSWVNWAPNFLTSYGSLNDLSDVDAVNPDNGQILRYNDLTDTWYASDESVLGIPTLQEVTDEGSTTTNTITAAGFSTAGSVTASTVTTPLIQREGILTINSEQQVDQGEPNPDLLYVSWLGDNKFVVDADGYAIATTGFKVVGGTSSGFLKADGTIDTSTYITSYTETQTLDDVTTLGSTTANTITVGGVVAPTLSHNGLLTINADSGGGLQPAQGDPAVPVLSFQWAGTQQGYVDTDGKITFNGFKVPSGTSSGFLKANGTVDTNAYITEVEYIDDIGDVTISSAAAGDVLMFDGVGWVNSQIQTDYTSKVQHEVKAGVAIAKGQAVYVTSADGTNMIVGLASNASEATSSKTMGLALTSAAVNGHFFVVTEGLIDGLDTSTATAGQPVWLGTNGNLIFGLNNKPVAPAHLVYLGVVTRANANNGEIFVHVQNGFELNEIHDALITSPTVGQLLRRDSDGLWKNWTPNYITANSSDVLTNKRINLSTGLTSAVPVDSIDEFLGQNDIPLYQDGVDKGGTINVDEQGNVTISNPGIGYYSGAASTIGGTRFSVTVAGNTLTGTIAEFNAALTDGDFATQAYVSTQIANLVDSAPSTLDTLNELAAALGDDPNFATTVATSIGLKQDKLNGVGFVKANGTTISYDNSTYITSESDPVFVGSAAYGITNEDIISWNDAYSWGNHAEAGYLTTIPDHTHIIADVTGLQTALDGKVPTTRTLTINGTAYDLSADRSWTVSTDDPTKVPIVGDVEISGMKSFTTNLSSQEDWQNSPISILERDGIGIDSASDIYSPNINFHWRNRVSRSIWMDASGGFHFGEYSATGVPSNDSVLYAGGGDSSRWNDAYSWGNHAGLYALASHNHDDRYYTETESDARFYLATNPSDYQTTTGTVANVASGAISNLSAAWTAPGTSISNGFRVYRYNADATNKPVTQDNANWLINIYSHPTGGSASYGHQLAAANNNNIYFRSVSNGSFSDWHKFWSTNDFNSTTISNWNTAYGWGNHAGLYAALSHTHDDRYYTESESDSRFLNVSGDTMDGSLELGADAVIKKRITADGFNPVKTTSGVLAAMSDNSSGSTYYVIETNVPQDEYQMGGFTIELFGRYGETNHKTKIDLAGYWNPESNGGFTGFEAHGTNPQYKPTIEVVRNNIGNTAFIIYGVSWSYPIIVARDLWLGYNSTDGSSYGEGWSITATNDVSSYINRDTVVWRNAYSDSNPAGYITGYTETDTLASVTGRGASTSTAVSLSGGATISGITNNGNLVNNGKIVVQNYTNGTNARGIFMWADADSNWGIYMATSAAGVSLSGGNSVASIDGRTAHHIRFRVYRASSNGFIWENDLEQCLMSLGANDGNLYTRGSIYPSNQTTHYVDSTRIQNWQAAYGWGNHASAGYAPLNAPSFTSNATLIGAHQSGYGMLRLESSDAMLLSMDSLGNGWNGLRLKNTGSDWAFFGKPDAVSDKIVIDFGFDGTNEFEFSSGGNLTIKGTITEQSSIRFKENITPLDPALDKVNQLEAVSYNKIGVDDREIGLIAEDVAELFPEVVTYNEEGLPQGIQYQRLSVILLKAVQELTERVNKLENK